MLWTRISYVQDTVSLKAARNTSAVGTVRHVDGNVIDSKNSDGKTRARHEKNTAPSDKIIIVIIVITIDCCC
jgi:hypothetical protein